MSPAVETFPASELVDRIQVLPNGKRRKGEAIDLKKCELLELVQYVCHLKGDAGSPHAVIQCAPVAKLFRRSACTLLDVVRTGLTAKRRCAGGLMVETTALEEV